MQVLKNGIFDSEVHRAIKSQRSQRKYTVDMKQIDSNIKLCNYLPCLSASGLS
jgi:hypothetical protein